ncbi:alpha/beta fold hydrolase [Rhodococcus opacus]|uniref:alpha/beta fold hydrolase n=1 Tax=Rhodococcus opacus TaxID=37919 RepID=UPI0024BB4DA2|nr:alpha/beta hydrolase [Rhodococcus opacus]MDJ0419874.1 alpha/beta hydrolase [Rhodococcus opacus]MDV6245267.1 alpha/beta hydrolase [Rhodococcus opacus]
MIRKRFRTDDIEISYLEAGDGAQTVVFIHGMAETADSCWSHQVVALSESHHCFAVDLRGHGESTVGAADATLEQLGGDLLKFLDGVAGPAVVIGFSLGATIALWAAAQQSPHIQHVIAVGGSSVISRTTASFFHDKAAAIDRHELRAVHEEMREEVGAMFHANPHKSNDYGARRIASIGEGRGYANAALAMARMREHPLQPHLQNVTCTVDIVGGEHDLWCPQKASDIILEGLPADGVGFTQIPTVGHLMSVDDPETVTDTLSALLVKANESK